MTLIRSIREGVVRAGSAPVLILFLWAVNLMVALPFAAVLAETIHDSAGDRLVSRELVAGFDPVWHDELEAGARGFERSFGPAIVGAGAFLRNLDAWWSGRLVADGGAGGWGLVAAGFGYALVWALLLGGVIDRLGRGDGGSGHGPWRLAARELFSAGGRYFFRFVRLAVLSGVAYLLIYLGARWLFGLIEEAARDVTVERTVLGWVVAGAALVVLLLSLVRVAFDYAKIAVVAEDRASVLGAAWSGIRFVARHPVRTLGLFWFFAGGALLLLWLYGALAPTAGPTSWAGVILAFLFGQLALATRLGLRLATLGGECALYRERP